MKTIEDKNVWIMLVNHFAGEMKAEDETRLFEWLKIPGHDTLYHNINNDWKKIEKMKTHFNVDNAWTTLHKRIQLKDQTEDVKARQQDHFKTLPRLFSFRIAASIIFIIVAGFILYASGVFESIKYRTVDAVTMENDAIQVVTLPDGSKVFLNSATTLEYPKHFKEGKRQVSLTGEAFFEVTADEANPFVIVTNGALIKAVGTSFNVNTNHPEQNIDVFVETGKVQLMEANNISNFVLLEPGYTGTIEQHEINKRMSDNKNCIAWKTREMVFNNSPLSEVLNVLNDVYKVEIIIREPEIDTTRIIGNYHNDPLDEILEVICIQNHLKIEKSDNKIYLSHI